MGNASPVYIWRVADVVDNVSDRMWQNDVLAQTFEGVLYQLMGHDVPTEILNSN